MTTRTRAEADLRGLAGEYDKIAAELGAGRRVEAAALSAYLETASRAHDEMGDDDRYTLRYGLGYLEQLLARGGQFVAADAFYRARLELTRRDYKFRFRDYRDVSALLRAWAFRLWRFSSRYGTSALRLAWVTFNVALWFAVLYFVLDVLAVRYLGQRAFASYAQVSYLSYFVVGFEGLFPGTAVFLANNFWAQLALALENGVGAVLILSLVSLVARRVWRGLG
ncbi:MAG: hypothetical protein GTN49_03855 [candidate division Zixibacteria bacterium]|nr:hypothetical protein [candidate division Zixibacteria bacterium]